tara:strand:- start:159 stop:614 length:456 start_codon:yes stop_codon:yes gene_type:complete
MYLNDLILKLNDDFILEKDMNSIIETVKKYNKDDYNNYVEFNNENFVKNLVYKNSHYEIFIINWNNNQETPIHDHADGGCIMKVLEGGFIQFLYNNNVEKKILKKNDTEFINNHIGFHKIVNGDLKTISLHIYSPPSHKTKIYNENLIEIN